MATLSAENCQPIYQEIIKNEKTDNSKYKNGKDDLMSVPDPNAIVYGMITAKEVAKYRACSQDIINRDTAIPHNNSLVATNIS